MDMVVTSTVTKILLKMLEETEVHLGEEPPPLPVPEFKISGTVPLDHLHCSQLLLSLGKSPAKQQQTQTQTSTLYITMQCNETNK